MNCFSDEPKQSIQASPSQAADCFYQHLLSIRDRYGPSSIAGFISSECSNEAAYLFQRFFRAQLGSNQIFASESLSYPWDPLRLIYTCFHEINPTFPTTHINESNLVLLLNTAPVPADSMVMNTLLELRQKESSRIVSLGLGSEILESISDIAIGVPDEAIPEILQCILWQVHIQGGTDRQIIWQDNDRFMRILKHLKALDPESVSGRWACNVDSLKQVARWISQKRAVSAICASSGFPYRTHFEAVAQLINLMVATGHVHHSGSGLYYFPHGKNAVGVNLFGCQPGSFPAMLSMENRTSREWFSSFWGAFDELPDVDFDEFFARALEKSIKALIYIGPPPWRYFPSRYQFLDAGRFDLIAGASDVFDPACRYWFPLNRTQKSRISFVRPDRTMQFVTPEAQQTAVSGFGLDDWSLLKQWIEEFPSNAPAMPVDAWNEISKTLQRKFSISDQVTAMDSVYWTPFTTHLTSGLDKNLDPFEFSGLFFLETGVSTASYPSKNTVLLMPRLKSSSSADLSQHMSRDALDVTVHPSMVEGTNRNPRGCIRFQGREFQIRLHVSEKIPVSCAVLELPEDHDWRLYIDAWSNTLTGELIL